MRMWWIILYGLTISSYGLNSTNRIWDAEAYLETSKYAKSLALEMIDQISWNGKEIVLDVGTGDGLNSSLIASKVPFGKVLGIDPSREMIDFAKAHYPPEQYPNLNFVLGGAVDFQTEERFDGERVSAPSLCAEMHFQFMKTSEGKIAYIDSGGEGLPIVFIHGNSCSSKVFEKQITHFSPQYRVVAIDLPGHGKSDHANHPGNAYTIPGYAKILDEVTKALKLKEFIVVGFSLGGNIALQWTQVTDRIKGVMMVSSAPMKYSEEAFLAYPPYEGSYAASPDALTESQAMQYMEAGGFDTKDPSVYFMIQDAMKTDGAARATMVASVLAGKGVDETQIVSELVVPLALVIGDRDNAIGMKYISQLHYLNLWQDGIKVLADAQHAIVYHQAEQMNVLLEHFIQDAKKIQISISGCSKNQVLFPVTTNLLMPL